MKNLKIGVKLVGGFILTALIILAVGIHYIFIGGVRYPSPGGTIQ